MECSKVLYQGGWTMLSPEGDFMCFIDVKKADWYISKGLAKRVSNKIRKRTIQILFKPQGCGSVSVFDKTVRVIQCVVCGSDFKLTKHHVVPYCYRKHICKYFPVYERDSHDILPLCLNCHKDYDQSNNRKSLGLRVEIAERYGISSDGKLGTPNISVKDVSAYLKYNSGLRHVTHEKGRESIQRKLADLLSRCPNLIALSFPRSPAKKTNQKKCQRILMEQFGYRTHGDLVIEQVYKLGEIDDFVRSWRNHFIQSMNPQFMPIGWRVDRPVFKTREERENYFL